MASAPAATSRWWIASDLIRVAQAPERRVVALQIEPRRDEPGAHGRVEHQGRLTFDRRRGYGSSAHSREQPRRLDAAIPVSAGARRLNHVFLVRLR